MADKTKPIPPVPNKADILENKKESKQVSVTWIRWFIQLRDKINVINDLIANLAGFSGSGFLSVGTSGTVTGRTIEGTTDRISVANGDGIAGNPVIDLVDTGITPGSYTITDLTVGADGRIYDISNGTGGAVGAGITVLDGGSIATTYDDTIDGGALPYRSPDSYDAGTITV